MFFLQTCHGVANIRVHRSDDHYTSERHTQYLPRRHAIPRCAQGRPLPPPSPTRNNAGFPPGGRDPLEKNTKGAGDKTAGAEGHGPLWRVLYSVRLHVRLLQLAIQVRPNLYYWIAKLTKDP